MGGHNGHHDLRHDPIGSEAVILPRVDSRGPKPSPLKVVAWAMPMEQEPQTSADTDTDPGRPSKSALKREASSLQELGVKLSSLPDQEIKELDLPDNLFVACAI